MPKTKHPELRSINIPGRPRKYASDLPVYDTMEICNARAHIPIAALKSAKKKGWDCFRHGRVDLEAFLKCFFAQGQGEDGDDSNIDWAKEDKKFAAQLKEIKVEEGRERVIDFALADRFIQDLTQVAFFGELERIREEFAVSLEGKTKLQIYQEVNAQIEEIVKVVQRRLDTWRKKKGKL